MVVNLNEVCSIISITNYIYSQVFAGNFTFFNPTPNSAVWKKREFWSPLPIFSRKKKNGTWIIDHEMLHQ